MSEFDRKYLHAFTGADRWEQPEVNGENEKRDRLATTKDRHGDRRDREDTRQADENRGRASSAAKRQGCAPTAIDENIAVAISARVNVGAAAKMVASLPIGY